MQLDPTNEGRPLDVFDDRDLLLDLDEAVDNLDGSESGGCCSPLLPGVLATRR
jgi:hypothetical protein